MSELLPCPFCGSTPKVFRYGSDQTLFSIRCTSCTANVCGFDQAAADAEEAWNKRSPMPTVAQQAVEPLDEVFIEAWHGDRKITVYRSTVIRVWGKNIDTEMSNEPRTLNSVQAALDWLYSSDGGVESRHAEQRPLKLDAPQHPISGGGSSRIAGVAPSPSDQDIRWSQVNAEPFEYAIQQGPHGDEFVKLLNGTCLRRPLALSEGERAASQASVGEHLVQFDRISFQPVAASVVETLTLVADRMEKNPLGWLPGVGECVNVTFDLAEAKAAVNAIRALTAARDTEGEEWHPIATFPGKDYVSYYIFNELWEAEGWDCVQRANWFEGAWVFDSGLRLDDCEEKFAPTMWHEDTRPRPPVSSTVQS